MLAMSVREAIREAVAAFGHALEVPLAAPATPEATLWAIEAVRSASTQPVAVPNPQLSTI
jgi:xanthine dehydrogenase large subunit